MERTQQLFEKIEEYLSKSLSPEDAVAFEQEMARDPELALEVEKHRELHRVLSDKDTLDFKEKLQKISKEIREEQSENTRNPATWYWKIAASVALLLGVGALLWNSFHPRDKISDLYLSHYQPYPIEEVTRGAAEDRSWRNIMKTYENGKYVKVIAQLEVFNKASKVNQIQLYLGNSYLNIGKDKEAILQFQKVSDTSKYYEDASWYHALAYLKIGDSERSIPILQRIVGYNGVYKQKAQYLIQELTEK